MGLQALLRYSADVKPPFAVILCTALLVAPAVSQAQTLSNVRIGDKSSALARLGKPTLTDTYKTFVVHKWCFENGNELSVTTDADGKIVYLELDWGGRPAGRETDLRWLFFGETTLSDLRKGFGSNGFAFKERGGVIEAPDGEGISMMNSYEVGTKVVTFITKVSATVAPDSPIADHATLDAISIADPNFARTEWGERVYDPEYRKIEWK